MDDRNLNENKPPVERDEIRTVYTYDKGGTEEPKTSCAAQTGAAYESGKPVKSGGWKKGFVIFLIIALVVVVAGVSCSRAVTGFLGPADEETYIYDSDYIAELHLEGTITDGNSGDGYSQDWIMERIENLTYDEFNRGIMLYVDSPGGSVYATAEVYKALKYYQEYTENPVYVYMGSMAASGGYYVSANADRIYANENCWTGSIGVIVGTVYDFSKLLENLGIKAINITSGENKGMGDATQPLTDEQKDIYQGLVDDAFDKFVAVVAEGRDMTDAEVRKIADGRVYTAGQALDNGLIDAVGELEEAYADMEDEYD
ncbi:MAG TPA: signal peptide peptidase SppA, partial [Candidatus Avanaerovorax faecigallinarum]|nr:signal peptide peptidase SppA [Candidatus Avanaerovorax faecigallinarum]